MQLITLTVAEENKLLVLILQFQEMLHLEEKLVTLLQKEQELNVNGP